ncbi:MFS transporter [Cognatishimia sp. F0-27]|uniref:MFS transporter n=1 Tax=Cognatishimia sp. F0-27 TaxID=2816855 RepID=UPI001D0C7398|nr:MFS transporter [Cognatishimia sp. F0-27]MCC1491656.1 MFS transporter [Cognatishimia sp. F0-27]
MSMLRDLYLSRGPAAAFACVGLYWGGFAALVPALKPQAGLSDAGFGLAMLVSAGGALLAMWLAPRADAGLGPRCLPVLAVALALAFLLPGLTTTGWTFALAMMLGAMASGTLDVVMNARLSVLEGRTRRSLMNLNHGIFSVGYAASAVFCGVARQNGVPPVMAFAALGCVTALLLIPMLRAPVADPEPDATTLHDGAAPPALLIPAGLIILVAFMAEQGTEGWSALHLERNHGASAIAGAFGPAILGLTMAVGRLSGQAVANRFSESGVIRVASVLSATGALLAAYAPDLVTAYIGFALLGLGVSVMAPMAFAWTGRLVPDRLKARAISRIAVLGYAGFFIGPPVMGFLAEGFGLPSSFTFIALSLLLAPLVLVPVMTRQARLQA